VGVDIEECVIDALAQTVKVLPPPQPPVTDKKDLPAPPAPTVDLGPLTATIIALQAKVAALEAAKPAIEVTKARARVTFGHQPGGKVTDAETLRRIKAARERLCGPGTGDQICNQIAGDREFVTGVTSPDGSVKVEQK
jgi:hypothetical protein